MFSFFFNRIRYEIVTKTTYKYSYKCVWQKIENLKKRRTRSARPVFNILLSLQHREQQRQKAEATFTATGTKQTSVESNNAQVQRILLYLTTLVCCSFSRRLLLNFFSRFNALIKKIYKFDWTFYFRGCVVQEFTPIRIWENCTKNWETIHGWNRDKVTWQILVTTMESNPHS